MEFLVYTFSVGFNMAWWRLSALLVFALPALAINEGLRDALYETCEADARNIIAKIKIGGRPLYEFYHLYISDSMGRKEEIQMEMIISECKETINNRLANGLDLDINKEGGEKGLTFLMETSIYGLVEISKALISAGADVNKTINTGESALMAAVRSGRPNITDLLLSTGADISYINRKNKLGYGYGVTILELANEMTWIADYKKSGGKLNYAADRANVVDVLKTHGASLPEFRSLTQVLESFGINLSEINDPLYRHSAEKIATTPLGFAAWYGRKDAVKILLEAGADVNAPSESQMKTWSGSRVDKALTFAVNRGSAEITKMLLDAGADVNTGDGKKPLEIAARFGYSDVYKILLEAGADINDGALKDAAAYGQMEICQMLLDAGADVNKKDQHGRTALMAARNRDTAQLLLSAGAELNMQDDQGYTALHRAILCNGENNNFNGDDHSCLNEYRNWFANQIGLGIAKMLIEAGADVNVSNSRGETALETAARTGYVEICQMLLEAGVDPNAGTLNNAIRSGKKDIYQMILDAGVDIDTDALVVAAENGYTEICQLLLDAGADVNAQKNDIYGNTALIVAGNMDIAKMLVSAGADLNKRNSAGYTAIYRALYRDHTDIARMLIEVGADVSIIPTYKDNWQGKRDAKKMKEKFYELETEIINDKLRNGLYVNTSIIRQLYVNKEDADGVSFLMKFVRDGEVEMSKLLISAGGDVNKIDLNGDSALLYAIQFDRPNIADFLLWTGADMNYVNQKYKVGYGLTPIEIANYLAMKTSKEANVIKYADVVDVLKKHGATVPEFQNLTQLLESFGISLAEVNETFKCSNLDIFCELSYRTPLEILETYFRQFEYLTPLESAAKYGRTDGVKLLLEAGAETDNKALKYAVKINSTEIIQMLLDAGADVNANAPYTALVTAATLGYGNICKILLEAGADINNGALEEAAGYGQMEICQMLLDAGADVNRKDPDNGKTVLMHKRTMTMDIAELFVSSGADLNIQDNSGYTALIWAMWRSDKAILRMLIEAGADLNIQDKNGRTALCLALYRADKDIARMLLEAGADVNICIKRDKEIDWAEKIIRTYAKLKGRNNAERKSLMQEMRSQG